MSNAFVSSIHKCLIRDLKGFDLELDAFADESLIWKVPATMKNSTGTLALHAAGNLRHFIGHMIGGSSYVRQRDLEFSTRDMPRAEVKQLLAAARDEINAALGSLTDAQLATKPDMVFGSATHPAPLAVTHLTAHLAYHLGQADIHRRVVTGNAEAVGTMGVGF